jgi:hypothetical protein
MEPFKVKDAFSLAGYIIKKKKPIVEGDIPNVEDLEAEVEKLRASESAENPPEIAEPTSKIETGGKTHSAVSEDISVANQVISSGTACIPCCIDHYSTCAGLISDEAIRMVRRQGIENQEIINRILSCRSQLNAMEREDLSVEKIAELPDWEKEIAILAQNESAVIRHKLSEVKSVEDLESVAIQIKNDYKEIGRSWLKGRIAHMEPEARARVENELRERAANQERSNNE